MKNLNILAEIEGNQAEFNKLILVLKVYRQSLDDALRVAPDIGTASQSEIADFRGKFAKMRDCKARVFAEFLAAFNAEMTDRLLSILSN